MELDDNGFAKVLDVQRLNERRQQMEAMDGAE
jgi:hypothetical protein